MIDSFASFFREYEEVERVFTEYITSFQYGLSQRDAAKQNDNRQLLQQLQTIENREREKKLALQHQIQEQISNLREVLRNVDDMERGMDEPRYHRFKQNSWSRDPNTPNSTLRTRQDINAQVRATIQSIETITHSRMPKAIAAICGFFNPSFRHDAYRQIAEQRDKLEQMVVNAEYEIHAASAQLQAEIAQATMEQVTALQAQKAQLDAQRISANSRYFTQLKELLLNGLESAFCGESLYGKAHTVFTGYTNRYLSPSEDLEASNDSFLLGIVPQHINAADDGTLDHFLNTILRDGLYSNGSILLPIALKKYYPRPICVTYQSNLNTGVYPLFSNYAIQLLDLYKDSGVSLYLVDCANLGAKYADFSAIDGDDDRRVNIIRTTDELKTTIDAMSEYIIESNANYLRNEYADIEEYNSSSIIKRENRLLFISNITELTSIELISKLETILRTGERCGVHTFIAISSDEYQVSGFTTQSRVSLISSLIEQCDRICMSSNGAISFGNGLPQLIAPPTINPAVVKKVLNHIVTSKKATSIIPFADYVIPNSDFFNSSCYTSIDIPIGLDPQGEEYVVHLDRNHAYMLVTGDPACGKSSLFHTIILQCITRYSSDSLELYLADLKDGTEFDVYAQRGIKSVKAILNDEEKDTAASFLQFIQSVCDQRAEKFKELEEVSGKLIRNIEQFYEVNNAGHYVPQMTRILVIIDEFQSLYNSSRVTGEITNWLVRMARTYGIYLIMASQRAQGDASNSANSFSNDTKEYFVYRGVMCSASSGARQVVPDQNSAVQKAPTLKTGQIIINPARGAEDENNQLVQCYYPNNETISTICNRIIERQGASAGVILNSEKPVTIQSISSNEVTGIIFGESNRLYYDICNANEDEFIDNYCVSIDHVRAHRVLVLGSDARVGSSVVLSTVRKIAQDYPNMFTLNILASTDEVSGILTDSMCQFTPAVSQDVLTFFQNAQNAINSGRYLINVIVKPTSYDELTWDSYSDKSDEIQQLEQLWSHTDTFTIVIADQFSRIKDKCGYCDSEIPHRIISVGNVASIRAAMTLDAAERINESPYNTIRPNVIKAYYYNKRTDKCGRCRLFNPHDLLNLIPAQVQIEPADNGGYSGLTGN